MDFENDIALHNELKKAVLYVSNIEEKEYSVPDGYTVLKVKRNEENGFLGVTFKKGDEVIVVFGPTNDDLDKKDDVKMAKGYLPTQFNDAISFYKEISETYVGRNSNLYVAGYSLGGALAQLVGATQKVKTVTFNAYGARNLLPQFMTLHTQNIVNYCNPKDIITTSNAGNHIGVCYTVSNPNFRPQNPKELFFGQHYIENFGVLQSRTPISKMELVNKAKWANNVANYLEKYDDNKIEQPYEKARKKISAKNHVARYTVGGVYSGYNTDLYKKSLSSSSGSSSSSECAGTYQVHAYTRDNGEHVKAHMRTCGAKHEN